MKSRTFCRECQEKRATRKVHVQYVPEGHTSKVNTVKAASKGALPGRKASLRGSNLPPALAGARAVGVRE
ncbi:hypothetical protein APY94_07395 [Thermococcus celericrescens]|uniref:Uncharacterized protein n=1 Tax=Thermococcus celericrescens TaxID=227598 RepID=A0A117IT64_9EURY|nr:hypothetical protein APY94_07395 [Thermococcus celericrescens]